MTSIGLGKEVLSIHNSIRLLLLLRSDMRISATTATVLRELAIIVIGNDNVVIGEGLIDDRLDRFTLLLWVPFLAI